MAILTIKVLNTYKTKNDAIAYKVTVNGVARNAVARGDSIASYIINFNNELKDLTGRTNLTLPSSKMVVGSTFEHDLSATATATARAPRVTLTNGHRTFASLSDDGLSVEYGAYSGRNAIIVGTSDDAALVNAFALVERFKKRLADNLNAEKMVAFSDARVALQKAESLRGVFDDKIVDDLVEKAKTKMPDLGVLLLGGIVEVTAKKVTAKKPSAKKPSAKK